MSTGGGSERGGSKGNCSNVHGSQRFGSPMAGWIGDCGGSMSAWWLRWSRMVSEGGQEMSVMLSRPTTWFIYAGYVVTIGVRGGKSPISRVVQDNNERIS